MAAPRVLVVHRVPVMRTLISQALESAGCTTIPVDGCHHAMECAGIDPPDVVIIDAQAVAASPDGFAAMQSLFPKVVIIALAPPPGHPDRVPLPGTHCELDKAPDDERLIRAVRWAMSVASPDPTGKVAKGS